MTSNNFPPATHIFDKSTNDGWDDWDWNDNNTNQQNPPKAMYSQQPQHLMHPSQQTAYPTNLHQQHPPQLQQQYAPQPVSLPPPPPPQSMHRSTTDHLNNQLNYSIQNNQNYYQGHPNIYQPHQHQTQQQPYNYSNPIQQQPPPPPAAVQSIDNNQAQNWQPYHQDTIPPFIPTQTEIVNQIFPKVSTEAVRKHDERENRMETFQKQQQLHNDESRQPDDIKNTQINNPTIARLIKSEHQLTPQWSIESQMSHTSSDRSIESDVLDSRSTNTSDEHQPMHHHHLIDGPSMPIDRKEYNQNIDNLDEVLMKLNVKKDAHAMNENFYQQHHQPNVDMSHSTDTQAQYATTFNEPTSNEEITRNFYNSTPFDTMQNLPKTNVSHLEQDYQMFHNQIDAQNNDNFQHKMSAEIGQNKTYQSGASQQLENTLPPKTSSTEFMPSPPTIPLKNPTPPIATSSSFPPASISPHPPPPPVRPSEPPAIDSAAASKPSTNPFKRSGMPVHKTYSFQSQNQQAMPPSPFQQFKSQQSQNHSNDLNQELLQPENAEIPDEISVNNDRNQYLQTGHLSEETYMGPQQTLSSNVAPEADNLPPPGLSRLVLGQPETDNSLNQSQQEPPPGLDRMIPGIEETTNPLNLERQADGQDTVDPLIRPYTIPTGDSHPPPDVSHGMDIPDRNLYRVPGESDMSMQRVVTGLDYRNLETPIVDQQRELDMDGENLDDPQQIVREEPIEGANTSDDVPQLPAAANNGDIDPNALLDSANKKFNSNPSTCDDSDKDRQMYYNRSSESRREDKRKRDKRHQRFDSEDTDYYSDQDKRRFNRDIREGSIRREHERSQEKEYQQDRQKTSSRYKGGGERGKDKYRNRDYDKRYGDGGDHYDRYDREKHDRDRERDRYSRYESEGSRYETEDSRYDRYLKKGERRDDRGRRYRRDDRSDREHDRDRVPRDRDVRDRDMRDRDPRDRDTRDRDVDAKKYSDHYYDGTKSMDRRRDKPRSRNDRYYDYDDEYRRTSSRNEMSDPDRSRGGNTSVAAAASGQMPNYYPANYGYDQYSYYQQQQYYETLRRTNPKAYAEWYKRYYSQQMAQAASDIGVNNSRDSVHSGRSSVNEKDRTNHLELSNINATLATAEPQRYTPNKFSVEHCVASLSNGLMVCVKPQFSSNDISNVVKVLNIGVNDSTRKLLSAFPGPLVRGTTHKKPIIEFCEDQIRLGPWNMVQTRGGNSISSMASLTKVNRSSYTLMWNLLILLLRQNGMVVGTDISELLLKNKSEFPYEIYASKHSRQISRRSSMDSIKNQMLPSIDGAGNLTVDDSGVVHENETIDLNAKNHLSEEEITDKFRNYLLYGNVNEALDWATDNNLWGHALFLASKVDRRSHANVLMKFANKLQLNDPLQTLYQLMSGKTPSSVTSIQDEKWGDWRPHLAMILANTSQKPDLDRKSITTLGDTLYNRGDLFAAQFCYLMAQVGFGKYPSVAQETTSLMSNTSTAVRLVLLGAPQNLPFKDFVTNEAILMTEIYEYACALNDDKFSIVDFQPFKYLLATRFIDYGMHLKGLMYLEQIAGNIQKDPLKYESGFIEKVYKLADQLKYFDPILDRMTDDLNNEDSYKNISVIEDQPWLQNLNTIIQQNSASGYLAPIRNYDPSSIETKSQIDQQFEQINQQFNELNLQYSNNAYDGTPIQSNYLSNIPQHQMGGIVDTTMTYDDNYPKSYYDPNSQQMHPQMPSGNNNYYYDDTLKQQQHQTDGLQSMTEQTSFDTSWNNQQNNEQPGYEPENDLTKFHSTPLSTAMTAPKVPPLEQQPNASAHMPNANHEPINSDIPIPTISMPNSMSTKSGFYDDSLPATTNTTAGSVPATTSNQQQNPSEQSQKGTSRNTAKTYNQSSNSNNAGWFGGIWNKLSLKPKNQMILPDDKNPAIVWDPDKKRWVNTDGGESDETEQFKPPPKLSELPINSLKNFQYTAPVPPAATTPTELKPQIPLANKQQSYSPAGPENNITSLSTSSNSNQNPTAAVTDPTATNKTPNLQSNMFKMQRNRTLKNSYVDVFNPSGAPSKPAEKVMAPVMPDQGTMPKYGFFMPDPSSAAATAAGAPVGQQAQPDATPHFYNPNQYTEPGYQQ